MDHQVYVDKLPFLQLARSYPPFSAGSRGATVPGMPTSTHSAESSGADLHGAHEARLIAHWIDGAPYVPEVTLRGDVADPATGARTATVALADKPVVDKAVQSAQ